MDSDLGFTGQEAGPATGVAPDEPDHYATLGIPTDADWRAIERAYFRATSEAKTTFAGDRAASRAAFKALSDAYAVLGPGGKRAEYDQRRGLSGPPALGEPERAPDDPGAARRIELSAAKSSGSFIAFYYNPEEAVLASRWRRLAGAALGVVLLPGSFALMLLVGSGIITVGLSPWIVVGALVAWLTFHIVWRFEAARHGQTPEKQLLGMYILNSDGSRAGAGWVWLRELVVKGLFALLAPLEIVAALWCVWDPNHQCLWDKMIGTYVPYSPHGFVPPMEAPRPLNSRRP